MKKISSLSKKGKDIQMANTKKNISDSYDNTSIVVLEGADRVRKRPAVIFGSDGIDGCQHSIFEIITNSIDEAREGYGNRIIVTRYPDASIEVEDFGRGIPVDYNKVQQRYNWELVFCELYAGGKYNTNQGGSYEFSLGLNGLGLCSTQYSSEFMDVDIRRDGYRYTFHFEKGQNVGGMNKEKYNKKGTGSKIHWKPDMEVFTDINVSVEYFQDILNRQALVNPGLHIELVYMDDNDTIKQEFYYENGIVDYVKQYAGDDALSSVMQWQAERVGRDREDKPEYRVKINAAICFHKSRKLIEYYHNSSFLEHGGAPDKAVRSAFVSQFDAYLKKNNKYNKNESKITFADIEESLILMISSLSTASLVSYANQTKKAITNKFIQEAMTEFFRHQLEIYFIENPIEAERVAGQVLINKRSREDAERSRLNIKKKLSGNIDNIANRVEKFVDCRSRDVNLRELYIVEGDSAMGACRKARNPDFQAIIPVRGKILNCLKADYDKIFKSDIIVDLCKVLGCGVEVKSKSNTSLSTFDLEAFRWNKVIICTDADVDGFQIRTLILTLFYRLMPTLIEKGKVYIAESPLYEINAKDETYFAYSEKEKADIIQNKIGDKKHEIHRSKGLGENQPDMMSLTTMNPATRRLIKVMPQEQKLTEQVFDMLLGDNLAERKEHIAEFGHLYLDKIDVS